MSAAVRYDEHGEMIGGGTRSVRLRLVNHDTVIPEQVIMSMPILKFDFISFTLC